MISDTHYIELYVNKQLVDIESQSSLNLRMNTVIFNPTRVSTTRAEYSYSFDIPSTPNNDRIFDYANNLSKMNKFRARYPSEIYADGELIFDGSLTIHKYSAREKKYTCNLVTIKIDTLEEIFSDMVMTDLKWEIPFDGAPTINAVNDDYSKKYFFPFVSYGVFQKAYVASDEVGNTYTPKHTLDKYNKWWIESFYPSLNVVETMRKAFEQKGYSVGGSVFSDPNINAIYASCNLASEQVPTYNLGNKRFGSLSLKATWNNYKSLSTSNTSNFGGGRISGATMTNSTGGLSQDLKFPYERVDAAINSENREAMSEYNFESVILWNMMDSTNNTAVTVTVYDDSYLYEPNEHLVVIPSDGWYKIYFSASATLSGSGSTFKANQWTTTYKQGDAFEKREIDVKRGLRDRTPIEIQLIRNYDENVELIKGKKNVRWFTGNPNESTYTYKGGTYIGGTYTNKLEWLTEYPHENLYGAKIPTENNGLQTTTDDSIGLLMEYGNGNEYYKGGSTRGGSSFGTQRGNNGTFSGERSGIVGGYRYNTIGFMTHEGEIMPYDQAVSQSFICGFSSLSDGVVSVMKNGYSWSKISSLRNKAFAEVKGLDLVTPDGDSTAFVSTNYCKNEYKQASHSIYATDSSINGSVCCCVWLNKDDVLQVVAVQRDYEGQKYAVSGECTLQIEAMSKRSEEELRQDKYWSFNSTTEFPTLLNLFNFTNKEKKVSDWLSDISKAFNLEFVMDSKHVDINTNQGVRKNITHAIDIDDRVSSHEAESEYISYPREMSVQYKIDTDEWGFELTVPKEHINDEDWKEWGDSGYTVIHLNDDTYETETQNTQTNFSYTYYDNFLWKDVTSAFTETDFSGYTVSIPTISKAEYMAEGYGYDEAMKHDGYSLAQRFWFRDQTSQEYVWLSSQLANGNREQVYLSYPLNSRNGFNLSYKDTEKSIVTEYFNMSPMLSSNYVNVEVYLTPTEYKEIKGGALVHFDSNLHYVSEINAYDPSGGNKTTLKLITKV